MTDVDLPEHLDEPHVVTAREPTWTTQNHVPDEDGRPSEVVGSLATDGLIEPLHDESTYECTCGVEMDSWDDVQIHFKAVTNTTDE